MSSRCRPRPQLSSLGVASLDHRIRIRGQPNGLDLEALHRCPQHGVRDVQTARGQLLCQRAHEPGRGAGLCDDQVAVKQPETKMPETKNQLPSQPPSEQFLDLLLDALEARLGERSLAQDSSNLQAQASPLEPAVSSSTPMSDRSPPAPNESGPTGSPRTVLEATARASSSTTADKAQRDAGPRPSTAAKAAGGGS